jgi:hypothetical protein
MRISCKYLESPVAEKKIFFISELPLMYPGTGIQNIFAVALRRAHVFPGCRSQWPIILIDHSESRRKRWGKVGPLTILLERPVISCGFLIHSRPRCRKCIIPRTAKASDG